MKRSPALFALTLTASLALVGCSNQPPTAAEPTGVASPTTAESDDSAVDDGAAGTATPSTMVEKVTPTPTPSPSTEDDESWLQTLEFSCSSKDKSIQFATLEEAWEFDGPVESCEASTSEAGETMWNMPSDREEESVEMAYGDFKVAGLEVLYGICAQNVGYGYDTEPKSSANAQEIAGAANLCPKHPRIDDLQPNNDLANELREEEESLEADRESGKLVGPGNYLVGSEVPAGRWQVQGDKVTDCYWETSDDNGEIIDNNFVSTGKDFVVTVPQRAVGFTVSGCSFRWIGK